MADRTKKLTVWETLCKVLMELHANVPIFMDAPGMPPSDLGGHRRDARALASDRRKIMGDLDRAAARVAQPK